MPSEWLRVDTIEGCERTYRKGSICVGYRRPAPDAAYLDRDLFIDGSRESIPMSAVYVPDSAVLDDAFYEKNLKRVDDYVSQRR